MNPSLRPDGRVVWDNCSMSHAPIRWDSIQALARDYWRYQRLTSSEQDEVEPNPWECVTDWMDEPAEGWVDLLTALVDTAADDQVAMVGVHCVEDLLTWHSEDEVVVDQIEAWGRRSPRAREAIQGMWLSSELNPEVAARLRRLGAH